MSSYGRSFTKQIVKDILAAHTSMRRISEDFEPQDRDKHRLLQRLLKAAMENLWNAAMEASGGKLSVTLYHEHGRTSYSITNELPAPYQDPTYVRFQDFSSSDYGSETSSAGSRCKTISTVVPSRSSIPHTPSSRSKTTQSSASQSGISHRSHRSIEPPSTSHTSTSHRSKNSARNLNNEILARSDYQLAPSEYTATPSTSTVEKNANVSLPDLGEQLEHLLKTSHSRLRRKFHDVDRLIVEEAIDNLRSIGHRREANKIEEMLIEECG